MQIDDPGLPDCWDMLEPEPTVEEYRKFARQRIDAVNHALAAFPKKACGIISAEAAGTGRTPMICRSRSKGLLSKPTTATESWPR